jgi:hypothetical protein
MAHPFLLVMGSTNSFLKLLLPGPVCEVSSFKSKVCRIAKIPQRCVEPSYKMYRVRSNVKKKRRSFIFVWRWNARPTDGLIAETCQEEYTNLIFLLPSQRKRKAKSCVVTSSHQQT